MKKIGRELIEALEQLGYSKKIDRSVLIQAIEFALISASKKIFGEAQNIKVYYNEKKGELEVFVKLKVVEKIKNNLKEISIEEAMLKKADAKTGEEIEVEMNPEMFSRIAAQTARQVVIQKVREAERAAIYEEYKDYKGKIISGNILHFDKRGVVVELGRIEGILPAREQVYKETYTPGETFKFYVLEVAKGVKDFPVILSRTHPEFVRILFEQEVPEITDGIVKVEVIGREPGFRTKIAVSTKEENIDPVGACLGLKGSRIQSLGWELRGEKIDVMEYSDDKEVFITRALAPIKSEKIDIDEKNKKAVIFIDSTQLALAIGRKGQNIRLISRFTGWEIDVRDKAETGGLKPEARENKTKEKSEKKEKEKKEGE